MCTLVYACGYRSLFEKLARRAQKDGAVVVAGFARDRAESRKRDVYADIIDGKVVHQNLCTRM